MGLISTEVDVNPCGKIKYYESLGYIIPRVIQKCKYTKYYSVPRGTTIRVKVLDLPKGSHANIICMCDECGKTIEMMYKQYIKCNHDGKIYCQHCATQIFLSGENNYQWKKDKTDEERINNRDYPEYDKFIQKVLLRDNYTCQCCKTTNCKLNVHHLDGYDWCSENRINEQNGITLCVKCHKNFHSIYGYGGNTKKQFEEWIGYSVDNLKKYDGDIPILREVYCFETNQVYQNIFEVAQKFNITDMSVRLCCNKKYRQCKGLHFLWNDEYIKLSKQEIDKYWHWVNNDNHKKKVICINTQEVFDSISSASKKYNVNHISSCLNGTRKTAGTYNGEKLRWEYYNNFI